MRKSKYDEVIPSKQINENDKQSSEIDKRIELSSEIINLNQQIDSIKKLSKELNALGTLAINTIDANEKSLKALNAAVKSSENIVNGILIHTSFEMRILKEVMLHCGKAV